MKKALFTSVAAITTLFAILTASSACIWGLYQPTEPKSLRH